MSNQFACLWSQRWTAVRVLLATIRDKGHCPCPRCLVPKLIFHRTGFVRNFVARLSRARTYFVEKVTAARQAVYVLGRPLKGITVETILKSESLVPTLVHTLPVDWCYSTSDLVMHHRTLFVSDYPPLASIYSPTWLWISSTSLSLVSWILSWTTCSAYYMLLILARLRFSMNGELKVPFTKQFLTCILLGSHRSLLSVSARSAVFHWMSQTWVSAQQGFLSRCSRYYNC